MSYDIKSKFSIHYNSLNSFEFLKKNYYFQLFKIFKKSNSSKALIHPRK